MGDMSSTNVFKELLLETSLCDTVIRTGDEEFKVHRIILCGCSSYFRNLFCSNPTPHQVYSFPDVSPNVMKLILDFAYTCSVTVTEDNVLDLLAGAERFGVRNIVLVCCDLLQKKLCSKNCIGIWKLADRYGYPDLRNQAHLHILRHFEQVAGFSPEFVQLSAEQLACFIEKDELNVRQERAAFEAILRWINYAPEERRCHLATLLSKVRLLLMSTEYLVDTVTRDELVRSDMRCMSMIIKAMKVLRQTNMKPPLTRARLPSEVLLAISRTRARLPSEVLLAISSFENHRPNYNIELYNVRTDCWITVQKSERIFPEFSGVAYLSGCIYCVGGCDANLYTSSVHKFDLVTQTWQEVGSMHEVRCYVSVAVLSGFIYAMGGCNKYETSSSAERFDPASNQWILIASMHERRADAGAAALHGKVYICGGFITEEPLTSAECYNPDTNQWTLIAPMGSPRTAAGVIGFSGQLYVAGGYNGVRHVSSVVVYDPMSRNWRTVAPMLGARSNFGMEVLEDQLYVVGGFQNDTHFCYEVERYDVADNRWHVVQDLQTPRAAVSCCVVERDPYASFLLTSHVASHQ